MKKRVGHIGIVLEREEDAEAASSGSPMDCYHWREPHEIKAIQGAIEALGFTTEMIGTPKDLIEDAHRLVKEVDFIYNLSVGFSSRNRLALAPAIYETLGIPFTGADSYGKLLSQNKNLLKTFFDHQGLPTPKWMTVDRGEELKLKGDLEFPLITKPLYEGSSIGIGKGSCSNTEEEVRRNVSYIQKELQMPVLIEEFIEGRELKVAFIGNERLRFRGMTEDVLEDGRSLGKEYLYFNAKTYGRMKKAARDFKEEQYRELMSDCHRLYQNFLPVDFGTFDVRMDRGGNHYFLEFNSDATMHPGRTLAKTCELNGVPFNTMIEYILRTAFERWGLEWK